MRLLPAEKKEKTNKAWDIIYAMSHRRCLICDFEYFMVAISSKMKYVILKIIL